VRLIKKRGGNCPCAKGKDPSSKKLGCKASREPGISSFGEDQSERGY